MGRQSLFIVFLTGISFSVVIARNLKGIDVSPLTPDLTIFRLDYNYHPAAEGWLKYHMIPSTWNSARRTCVLEGAHLASPINDGLYYEMRMLQGMSNGKSIHTGIHTMATKNDFLSEEGIHISEMPLMWAENEPDNLNDSENCIAMLSLGQMADVNCNSLHAFMCYKEKNGTSPFNECASPGYEKNSITESCYNFHKNSESWYKAHSTCIAEGGHLAIINSHEEAEVLNSFLKRNNHPNTLVHIGFYNWARQNDDTYRRWTTLDGKTLDEAGYPAWAKGEPNNVGGNEFCGSFLHRNAEPPGLVDIACSAILPFICEINNIRISHFSL